VTIRFDNCRICATQSIQGTLQQRSTLPYAKILLGYARLAYQLLNVGYVLAQVSVNVGSYGLPRVIQNMWPPAQRVKFIVDKKPYLSKARDRLLLAMLAPKSGHGFNRP
jgi:hypothetical protein